MTARPSPILPALLLGCGLAATALAAPDKTTKPGSVASGAFETVEVEGKAVPPVALGARMEGGRAVCEPGELQVPAGPIDLRVRNDADAILTLASPDLFAKGNLVRFDGPAGHAASELGFTIRPHAEARIVVRTPGEGRFPFTCAVTSAQGAPFAGTLTVAAPAR